MKTTTYCKLMFIFFGIVLISFIGKLMTRRSPELHIPTKTEVIQHNYDEPTAFVEDSTTPEYKRAYYDRLYDY